MTNAMKDYAARKAEAESLITRLTSALEAHHAKANERTTNWGYAGDLGAFNKGLIHALDRVGGLTAAERQQHCL